MRITENKMIMHSLNNFVPNKINYEPRIRDHRPIKKVLNPFNIALSDKYRMRESIGDRLIHQIRRSLIQGK